MQDWFREHQILKKVLVVQLPRHLEFLEMLILLRKQHIRIGNTVRQAMNSTCLTAQQLSVALTLKRSTDQGEQEAADGACSLTEGAVLLQQQGDELVGLRRTMRCSHGPHWSCSLGTCR